MEQKYPLVSVFLPKSTGWKEKKSNFEVEEPDQCYLGLVTKVSIYGKSLLIVYTFDMIPQTYKPSLTMRKNIRWILVEGHPEKYLTSTPQNF